MTIGQLLARWSDWRGSGPPSNVVALELTGNFVIGPVDDQLHIPLRLDQPWMREHFANGVVGGFRYGGIRFDNFDYEVVYWSGPAAPASDRVAVLRALRSIRPTR